jgi:hypothetical protein
VQAIARRRAEFGIADRDATARADDLALVEQVVGDLHGRGQQAARVAAQVEHQAAQLAAGLQLVERAREIGGGVGLERRRRGCSRRPGSSMARTHAGDADAFAHRVTSKGLGDAFAHEVSTTLVPGAPRSGPEPAVVVLAVGPVCRRSR